MGAVEGLPLWEGGGRGVIPHLSIVLFLWGRVNFFLSKMFIYSYKDQTVSITTETDTNNTQYRSGFVTFYNKSGVLNTSSVSP